MLKQSSDFANALANESGKLQTAVQSLTKETAAALEEITSSMQNVSVKTSDVITQSEEIKNVTGIIGDIADRLYLKLKLILIYLFNLSMIWQKVLKNKLQVLLKSMIV